MSVAATRSAPPGARPPGPGGPAWANLARYLRDPLGTMTALREAHGPVAHVPFPGDHSFFFVTDGALIRRILVDDHAVFVKGRALRAARRLLGDGLLTSEGPEHLARRRRIQPLFGATPIEGYAPAMAAAAQAVSDRWADGARVDVNEAMMGLALDVVGRTIFDADVESEAPEIRAVLEAGMRVFHRFLLPGADLLWRLPLPATRRFDAAKRDVDRVIAEMLAARPAQPRGGLLDHLVALRDENGARLLSDEQIRDEAITFVMAGHETTAQALTWAWHLLAANPAARSALEAEVDGVLGGRVPGPDDAARLPYTTAVFRESLRLYPPVWALARIATRPYALGPYRVPEGGTIVTSQWVVHRAPEHFADPLAFRPERWLDEPPPAPGTYFPFAAGPRLCIGERFAILEGVLVLAVLAARWRIEPAHADPQIDARFTLRPRGGLPATVRARRA